MIYAGTAQSLNDLAHELLARELLARGTLYQSCHSLRIVAGLQRFLSGKIISTKHIIYTCNSYRIGTDENSMKIKKKWSLLLTTIRKARNHCQDVDNCQYHLGIDHCQDGNRIETPVKMEMSTQMIKTSCLT